MATATLNLDEIEIIEAIVLWARSKGYQPLRAAGVSLHHDKGDRPTDRETFTASIQVVPIGAPSPSPAP